MGQYGGKLFVLASVAFVAWNLMRLRRCGGSRRRSSRLVSRKTNYILARQLLKHCGGSEGDVKC